MKKFEEMSEQELIKLRGQLTLGQIGAMVTYCSLPFVSLLDVKYDNTIPTIGYWTVFLSLSFMKNKINKELGRTVDPKLKIELLNLYKEILNNLKELNDKFDNENLIERYSLLEYLYNNKYLSINGDKKVIDNGILEADMMGALSLNGHGVCRHTSFLTEDYLKMFNYDAGVLTGLHESNPVKVIESLKYDDEYDEFEDEMIDKFVAIIKEHEEDFKENFSLIEKIFGNHQICMANDQEHSYYLDLTNNSILIPNGRNEFISNVSSIFSLRKHSNILIYHKGFIKKKDPISFEDYDKIKVESVKKYKNNKDLISSFYTENTSILEECEEVYRKILSKNKKIYLTK